MATEILSGPLGEIRAASTAGGGTAVTSTAARLVLPFGSKWISMTPRLFATAVVVKFNFNPWLTVLKTSDALATQTNLTDYSVEAQDGSTSTSVTLSSLDTLANGDALYVGSHLPFSGVHCDVDAANGTASVLTVHYWNGSAWTDTSATDGTDSGGATFAQDGAITWTVPSAWVTTRLAAAVSTAAKNVGVFQSEMFWTRFSVSAALDSSTTLDHMLSINRSTAYGELVEGQVFEEAITVGPGGIASVTHLTDAGTASLVVNVATRQNGMFA